MTITYAVQVGKFTFKSTYWGFHVRRRSPKEWESCKCDCLLVCEDLLRWKFLSTSAGYIFLSPKKRVHWVRRGINSERNRKIMESWWGGSCVGAVEQGSTPHRAARPESGRSAGECWPRWSSNFLSGVYVGFAPTERHPEAQLLALCTAQSSRVITMQCDLPSHATLQSALLTCNTSRIQLADCCRRKWKKVPDNMLHSCWTVQAGRPSGGH